MKRFTYLAMTMLAIGGVGVLGCTKEETKQAAQDAKDATKEAAKDTKDAAKAAKDATVSVVAPSGTGSVDGARNTLEGIVEGATKRNEWGNLADHFTAADATRAKAGKPETKDIDDLADSFTKAWNDKYKDAFTVMSADKVFAADFMTLATDASGTKEMPKANGTIKASHGMPELPMTFVGEGGKWRLDVPDDMDSAKLHGNLKAALTDLQDVSKLPDDKNDAYRHACHRILLAVMNKGATGGTASAE